jgi:hypothetical protein
LLRRPAQKADRDNLVFRVGIRVCIAVAAFDGLLDLRALRRRRALVWIAGLRAVGAAWIDTLDRVVACRSRRLM